MNVRRQAEKFVFKFPNLIVRKCNLLKYLECYIQENFQLPGKSFSELEFKLIDFLHFALISKKKEPNTATAKSNRRCYVIFYELLWPSWSWRTIIIIIIIFDAEQNLNCITKQLSLTSKKKFNFSTKKLWKISSGSNLH